MGFDSEDFSFIFPYDFARTKVDVPELAGIYEGDATITYVAKNYPDWSPFYLFTKFVDNVPHGKATLVHKRCIVMEAEYKNGWLFYQGQRCPDGILLNPLTGCRIVKKGHTVNRDSTYGKLLPEPSTSVTVEKANEEANEEVIEEVIEESDAEEDSEEDSEEEIDVEQESYSEMYEDDVYVSAANSLGNEDIIKLVNYIWETHVKNPWGVLKSSSYTIHADAYSLYIIYLSVNSIGYMLVVRVRKGNQFSIGLLYSERTMKLEYVVTIYKDKVVACDNAQSEKAKCKKAKKTESVVLDVGYEGHRWEGEIRNSKPNGDGQFYNESNELIYEGQMVNGAAKGYGTSFFPGLGVVSYKGMWRNGMRYGIGTSYDREGNVINHGLFVNDQYVRRHKDVYVD